jgi:hypothetical protein
MFVRFDRRRLNPEFRARIKRSGFTGDALTAVSGFTDFSNLYTTLHDDYVRASPLTIRRLEQIAAFVGFDDPIFVDGDR